MNIAARHQRVIEGLRLQFRGDLMSFVSTYSRGLTTEMTAKLCSHSLTSICILWQMPSHNRLYKKQWSRNDDNLVTFHAVTTSYEAAQIKWRNAQLEEDSAKYETLTLWLAAVCIHVCLDSKTCLI